MTPWAEGLCAACGAATHATAEHAQKGIEHVPAAAAARFDEAVRLSGREPPPPPEYHGLTKCRCDHYYKDHHRGGPTISETDIYEHGDCYRCTCRSFVDKRLPPVPF